MIYLSGAIRPDIKGIGFMVTRRMGNKLPPGRFWAADNGRYASPQEYSDDGFLAWLRSRDPLHCLFATAPDVLADHHATVAMSLPMLPRIRALGYKAAFVAQDGWDDATVPWDEFDCLFIGGTTAFKLGQQVRQIVVAAHDRAKWVHMGRVNSLRRLRYADDIGCDSVDGTFIKFGPDLNGPKVATWLDDLERQPSLLKLMTAPVRAADELFDEGG